MLKTRLIPVLIVNNGQVVQSIQFKLTNVIHANPATAIDFFDKWAADEIVVLDVSRDLSKRELFYKAVHDISNKCFVPLSVGGWIRTIEDVKDLLRLGADKVVINTQAVNSPNFVTECSKAFGSQCIVISIDVWRSEEGFYEVVADRARVRTGLEPVEWAKQVEAMGAGEIFFNCVNNDGFRQGYDLNLLREITKALQIPVIAMGGVFTWQHLVDGVITGGASAVAAANILHYTEHSTKKAKKFMSAAGIELRN